MLENPFIQKSDSENLIDQFNSTIFHSYKDATAQTNGAARCSFDVLDEDQSHPEKGFYQSSLSINVVRIVYNLVTIRSGDGFIFVWAKQVKEVTK